MSGAVLLPLARAFSEHRTVLRASGDLLFSLFQYCHCHGAPGTTTFPLFLVYKASQSSRNLVDDSISCIK